MLQSTKQVLFWLVVTLANPC